MKYVYLFIMTIITFTAFSDELPFEIERIQNARDMQIDKINKQYNTELLKQRKKYISRKDYKSVQIIDKLLIEIADQETTKIEERTKIKIYTKAKLVRFKNETPVFMDKKHPYYSDIPDAYDGWKVSTSNIEDDSPLEFKVKRKGKLTIVVQRAHLKEMIDDGWTNEYQITNNGQYKMYHILSKEIEVGEYSFDGKKVINILIE